jgi:hypothetical protein
MRILLHCALPLRRWHGQVAQATRSPDASLRLLVSTVIGDQTVQLLHEVGNIMSDLGALEGLGILSETLPTSCLSVEMPFVIEQDATMARS